VKARWTGTNGQQAAMKKEIRRQILEHEENYTLGVLAVLMWSRHVNEGHGKVRLERMFNEFWSLYWEMREFYEMDGSFPAEHKLKEIGIDIDELMKKVEEKHKNEQ
jgi:hypothetical protein